jgi:dTDP-4-amino-4,6-dideoxygalactose transaminase
LIVDVDPQSWTVDPARRSDARAPWRPDRAIVPYATFGTDIDLDRYAWLARRHGVGVVVDAAASLGTLDERGRGRTGAPFTLVYSMHATKTFSVGGGLVYSGDGDRIDQLRAMVNFGFERGRVATLPGINAKMPEILARWRARNWRRSTPPAPRADLDREYRDSLPGYGFQASKAAAGDAVHAGTVAARHCGAARWLIAALAARRRRGGALFQHASRRAAAVPRHRADPADLGGGCACRRGC